MQNVLLLATCLMSASALASPQAVPSELEATITVLDDTADLDATIEEGLAAESQATAVTSPGVEVYDDELDEEADDDVVEIEERNAFSDLQDDFEHDDVDIDNKDDLDDEDDFEEDEEVDVEILID